MSHGMMTRALIILFVLAALVVVEHSDLRSDVIKESREAGELGEASSEKTAKDEAKTQVSPQKSEQAGELREAGSEKGAKDETKTRVSREKSENSPLDNIPQYPTEDALPGLKDIRKAMQVGPGGDLSLTIPLLTVPGKIRVPINLSYRSQIGTEQSASWVGLGWNLGYFAVTRTEVFGNDAVDSPTQPKVNDTYEVVTPTNRYTFINYGSESEPNFVPLKYSADSLYCSPYRSQGLFHDGHDQDYFILTTADGTRYIFGQPLKKAGTGYLRSVTFSTFDAVNFTWLLTAILGPDYIDGSNPVDNDPLNSTHPAEDNKGSWVAFTYAWDNQNEGDIETALFGSDIDDRDLHTDTTEVTYPYRIVTPSHVLQFFTSEKRVDNLRWKRSGYCGPDTTRVKDRRLDKMRLYRYSGTGSAPAGKSLTGYAFKYKFDCPSLWSCYQFELKRRKYQPVEEGGEITLTDVYQEPAGAHGTWRHPDGPEYHFGYCDEDDISGVTPYVFNDQFYKWWVDGYWFPPFENDLSKIPQYWRRDFFGYRDSIHTLDPEKDAAAWNLTHIILPTGGAVILGYENDRYRYDMNDTNNTQEMSGGGCRVKQIVTDDGLGKMDTTYFTYGIDDDGYGYPTSMPAIYFKWENKSSCLGTDKVNPRDKFYGDNVSHTIQYPKITEHYPDGGVKETYYITSDSTGFDSLWATGAWETPDWVYCGIHVVHVEYILHLYWDRSPFHGLLFKTVIKDGLGEVISSNTRYYSWVLKHAYVGSQAVNNFPDYDGDTLAASYFVSLDSVITTKDGVESKKFLTYDQYTGQPTKIEEQGNNDNRIALYDYAYDHYLGMKSKHMLSQPYEKTVVKNSEASGNYASSNRTIWDNGFGNSSQWYVSETQRWKDENDDGTIQGTEYFATKVFESYNDFGNPTEWADANGVPASAIYDEIQRLPAAVVTNAVSSEISQVDFEEGTKEDWGLGLNPGYATGSRVHTGELSWRMGGQHSRFIGRQFYAAALDTENAYILSGWIRSTSQYPGLQWTIIYDNGSSYREFSSPYHPSGTGEWEYVEAELDLSQYDGIMVVGLYARNCDSLGNLGECYWDDLRFHPKDAMMTTTTYTPTHKIGSKSDENSLPIYYLYDFRDRPLATARHDKQPISTKLYYLPSTGSASNVNGCLYPYGSQYPAALGYVMSTATPTGGYVDDFSENTTDNYTWWGNGTNEWDAEERLMIITPDSVPDSRGFTYDIDFSSGILSFDFEWWPSQDDPEGGKSQQPPGGKTEQPPGACRIYLYNDSTGNSYVAGLDGQAAPFEEEGSTIDYVNSSGDVLARLAGPTGYGVFQERGTLINVAFARIGELLYVFTNGKLLMQAEDNNLTSFDAFKIEFRMRAPYDTGYCLDNIAFVKDPMISIEYFDGLGQTIQTQKREGDDAVIVSGIVYDESGRPALVTKEARYDSTFWGYRYDFVNEDTTWEPGDPMTDSSYVNTYYDGTDGRPDCEDYPYSYTTYRTFPDNRKAEQGFPGSDFRIGGGHSVQSGYTANDADEIVDYGADELLKTNIVDENGVLNQQFRDKFGNLIATVQDSAGERLVTKHKYDVMGNLLKTMPPIAYESEMSVYRSLFSYNTLGQLTVKSTTDDGSTRYMYDKNGNLRYSQDMNQYDDQHFTVRYYDATNRLILEGVEKDQTLYWWPPYPPLDDTTFGKDADEWRVKYYYDEDYVGAGTNYCKGRLTKEEVSDETGTVSNSALYRYDQMGNVVEKRILIGALNKVIQFEYDVLNRLTKIVYPDTTEVTYTYDQAGRLYQVGDDADPDKYATYTYFAAGLPKQVVLGNSAQTVDYEYNPRDWPLSVNEGTAVSGHFGTGDHFGLELAYTSGGWGGASYYNGNVAGMTEAYSEMSGSSDRTLGYGYDGINRLRQAAPEINDTLVCCLDLCAYDPNSNLTYHSHAATPDNGYVYGWGTNRLDYIDGMPGHSQHNYAYDGNGNMISDDSKSITLQYDYRNMLTQVTKEVVLLGRTVYENLYYDYDARGRRVRKLHVGKYVCECGGGGGLSPGNNGPEGTKAPGPGPGGRQCICTGTDYTYYIYSGNMVIAEYDEEGARTNKYIYAGDDRIAIIRNTEQGDALMFLLKDHLGTTRVVVKDNGEVGAKYQYYSFGDEYSSWISQGTDYKFTGKELDEEIGVNLYYFGARYYDARIGRWVSVDPQAQRYPEWSPYVYALDNPLKFNDPDGEDVAISIQGYQDFRAQLKEYGPDFIVDIVFPEKPDLGLAPVPLASMEARAIQLAVNRVAGRQAEKLVANQLQRAGKKFAQHVTRKNSILDFVVGKDVFEVKGINWAAKSYQKGGGGLRKLFYNLRKQIDKYKRVLQKGEDLTVTFVGKPKNQKIVKTVEEFARELKVKVEWK